MSAENQKQIYVKIFKNNHFSINGASHYLAEHNIEKLTGTMQDFHERCFHDQSIFAYQSFEDGGKDKDGRMIQKNVSEPTYFITEIEEVEPLIKRMWAKKLHINCNFDRPERLKEDDVWTDAEQDLLDALYSLKDQKVTHIASIRNEPRKLVPTRLTRMFNMENKQVWGTPNAQAAKVKNKRTP